ncbi:MAG: sigma-70 family RNA polymerase sigma factor [Acidobacteria bacterium]|nr:sigma-70 family RNA polymerase sigma factor [Acidobacteriota bacterium]
MGAERAAHHPEGGPIGPLPDGLTALALAARAGGQPEADRLWEAARQRLTRIGLALRVDPGEVPDLVQDVLLAAHGALGRFDPQAGSFEAWIAAILLRRARNRRRAERRFAIFRGRYSGPARAAARFPSVAEAVDARLTLERLLESLTAVQRRVVALYEIGELPADEVAGILGITAAGVRSIARDARQKLTRAAGGGGEVRR